MVLTRARVESRDISPNASYQERDIAFKKMFTAFKKQCTDAGIQHAYKQHEFYESPGRKKRRKSREAASERLKAKLKENFPKNRGIED